MTQRRPRAPSLKQQRESSQRPNRYPLLVLRKLEIAAHKMREKLTPEQLRASSETAKIDELLLEVEVLLKANGL